MIPVKRYVLVQQYKSDPSIVYELTREELDVLLVEMGEMEPIIDAMNVLDDATYEQRAKDLGCHPGDFWYERVEGEDWDKPIVFVDEIEF